MICEYCKSTDGERGKYHPETCGHCGAELKKVYCLYYGKPITDYNEYKKALQKTVLEYMNVGAIRYPDRY